MNYDHEIRSLISRVKALEAEVRMLKRANPGGEWMTIEEFIKLTGVKRSTAWKYSSEGLFRTKRKGGLKFHRQDVLNWFNQ